MLITNDKLRGLLLGTAVGDALGLPMEGLNASQISKLGWLPNTATIAVTSNYAAVVRHRLIWGHGMISDDTEHTLLAGLCLLRFSNNVEKFRSCFAWKLRLWFLALPPGIGFATGRAIIKLLLGVSPVNSGVYSAGNGPAMRAAIIGAVCYRDLNVLKSVINASTCMTHTDRRALIGAWAVALGAAYVMARPATDESASLRHLQLFQYWHELAAEDVEWQGLLTKMAVGLNDKMSVADFVHNLGFTNGISGYIYQTVPVALYAWLRHYGDFAATLTAVLALGGDTDTVGAIAGALAGVVTGEQGIPKPWIDGIVDWPRSINLLIRVADALTAHLNANTDSPSSFPIRYFYPAVLIRNLLFLLIVLFHGLCRLLPLSINPLRDRSIVIDAEKY